MPTICFSLVGVNWFCLILLALMFLRPHPLDIPDYLIGAVGCGLGGFYLWVAQGVFRLRRQAFNPAMICACLGLLSFPTGTLVSIFLIGNLASRRYEFTR